MRKKRRALVLRARAEVTDVEIPATRRRIVEERRGLRQHDRLRALRRLVESPFLLDEAINFRVEHRSVACPAVLLHALPASPLFKPAELRDGRPREAPPGSQRRRLPSDVPRFEAHVLRLVAVWSFGRL